MTPEQLQELIDDLNGTCCGIPECLPTGFDESDLTPDQLIEIDQQIFRCEVCEWWFELEDESEQPPEGQRVCVSCEQSPSYPA